MARCAAGDERALGALYDRYSPMMYGLALRVTGESADAEEAVLDAFSQAWRDAGRFTRERGSVPAWLTMLVRSRALDLVRARGRRERLVEEARAGITLASSVPADRRLETEERRAEVSRVLAELPTPQREAIVLAYFHGLSQTEISEHLQEPLGTVKTRVRAGMQKLREQFLAPDAGGLR